MLDRIEVLLAFFVPDALPVEVVSGAVDDFGRQPPVSRDLTAGGFLGGLALNI